MLMQVLTTVTQVDKLASSGCIPRLVELLDSAQLRGTRHERDMRDLKGTEDYRFYRRCLMYTHGRAAQSCDPDNACLPLLLSASGALRNLCTGSTCNQVGLGGSA